MWPIFETFSTCPMLGQTLTNMASGLVMTRLPEQEYLLETTQQSPTMSP